MTEPLPDGWSVSNIDGRIVIQMPQGVTARRLSRDELKILIVNLVAAVESVDPPAKETALPGFGSIGLVDTLAGWAVYVESDLQILVEVDPRDPYGYYELNVSQAAALWRSLQSAYWLADEDISRAIKEGTWLRGDRPENGENEHDADGESPQ